ncbi:MAG: hypothetical protein LBQ47_06080 [Endomicrobium sp.]|jgi:uncharacterized membrane protein|nr:hypothetical protein [Endomicrobium sp.]
MATSAFDIKEVFSLGWEAFKKNALILIILLIISLVAALISAIILTVLNIPSIISFILSTAVNSYFMLSILRASLAASNEETPSWSVLKNGLPLFLKFFIVGIIFMLIPTAARIFPISLVLIIIFVILVFFVVSIFFPAPYILANKPETGIIDAFKISWMITAKNLSAIIPYMFLWAIILAASSIPLGLGLLISVPAFCVSLAYVYKKLDASVFSSAEIEAQPVE